MAKNSQPEPNPQGGGQAPSADQSSQPDDQAAAQVAADQAALPKSTITVTVPKAFKLLKASGMTDFAAGVQEMEPADVEHWYSKAMGVEPYKA